MITTAKNQNELTQWAFNIIKRKAKFDLDKKYTFTSNVMVNQYIEDCSYAMTVSLKPSSPIHVHVAQSKLHRSFNEYSLNVLGSQCMDIGKVNSRNRQFMPFCFLAFDIEGTRHNGFDVMTTAPHGHGVIMFDTHTVFNFRKANARSRCEDGSYKIINPTRDIAKIELIPFCSIGGVKKYIHYSLKYAAKLKDNQINFRPYDFYPPTSVNYPFWKYLAGTALHSYELEPVGDEERDALEWLWNLDNPDSGVSRDLGHGGSAETVGHQAI
ncbi:hypothetical protein [Pararhizobium antarcticum]|uniref:hypothetical protein n=1 Tax=Pararhizobium antarcticum TaxID=1798805 RepID=UPI000A5C383C|nr:hypothetical protein [Pararhizobium antarcticum]